MKTSKQWREELKRRLAVVNEADRSATAAIIRQFIVEVMSEDQSTLAIHVRGVTVYPEFGTQQDKLQYIQKMGSDKEWLEYPCVQAFAAALDISLKVHASSGGSSEYYQYQSSEAQAPIFHMANFSGTHWSAAVKDDNSGLLDIKPTPGDGNCGAHALYDIWQMYENNLTHTPGDLIDAQIAETIADQALIYARKNALEQVFISSKSMNSEDTLRQVVFAVADTLAKDVDNQGKLTDLGQFFKKLDTRQPLENVVGSMIARISVDQESTDLLLTTLTGQNEDVFVAELQKALNPKHTQQAASSKPSVVGMFSKNGCPESGVTRKSAGQSALPHCDGSLTF